MSRPSRTPVEPGMTFGRWTVEGPSERRCLLGSRRWTWCRCACGFRAEVTTCDLRAGRTRGCLACAVVARHSPAESAESYARLVATAEAWSRARGVELWRLVRPTKRRARTQERHALAAHLADEGFSNAAIGRLLGQSKNAIAYGLRAHARRENAQDRYRVKKAAA